MMSENSACCGCNAGESMEDMPMCRYSNPIPTCEHKRGCGSRGGRCSYEEELEQILAPGLSKPASGRPAGRGQLSDRRASGRTHYLTRM